ncbi:dibenzothiophene desulfurase [Brevirhabdus pacifica]|uniref:Dibenzothiophene desulfurase n=2 Tax=Brevirhabdus pacifica TaxID=1267768 RepID=A0A1U7DGF1_9RHOB|nr:DmsC/YnfH family molybdoenzyme membrane anchor subunit [Brevirhabdus pacifica]APX89041.1 dibenzothiophene desulfurase [Brevirhabdus pacifica]OWU80252.1 dibenzothiophene desulfurase [Loktanella sp. 22II-4b]PJJ86389.1 DMSO reductase anchor subunit [Brevirhabdus pacifica]
MHPAPSIILFTVLSGLGFGLLFFLGLDMPPVSGWTAFWFLVIAYVLAVGGLLASTFHLGHPERALKSFTQWRSSWLSREGWASVATLLVMGAWGGLVVFFDTDILPLGWLGAVLSLITVGATSMIYTQLRTVPRWNHWHTPALFLLSALSGGALLAGQVTLAIVLLIATGLFQIWAWHAGDRRFAARGHTVSSATGLGRPGFVRLFEPPHTGSNYLTREMVFTVARRHVAKLRLIGLGLFSVLPVVLLLLPFNHFIALGAVLSHVAGAFVLRWLFFAQAEHVVGLYYGRRDPAGIAA